MRDTVHRNLSIYRIRDPVLRTYNWVRGLRITDIYSIYLLCLFPRFNSYGFALVAKLRLRLVYAWFVSGCLILTLLFVLFGFRVRLYVGL